MGDYETNARDRMGECAGKKERSRRWWQPLLLYMVVALPLAYTLGTGFSQVYNWGVTIVAGMCGMLPAPGEWWLYEPSERGGTRSGDPWAALPTEEARQPPELWRPLCHYVREVRDGWVRYYGGTATPDRRDPVAFFLLGERRVDAAICRGSYAAEGLRCPPGTALRGVRNDHAPDCGPETSL
jgi:hypothetical protein